MNGLWDFSLLNILLFFFSILTFFMFQLDILEKNGWSIIFGYLKIKNVEFIRWGKNQKILESIHCIQTVIRKLLFCFFILLFLTSLLHIQFFTYFTGLFLAFLIFTLASFDWVLHPKEKTKKFFIETKTPILFFLTILFFSLTSIPSFYEEMKSTFPEYAQLISISEIYFSVISVLLLMFVFTIFGSYIFLWLLFGLFPTIFILFLYLLTLTAYLFEKIIYRKTLTNISVLITFFLFFIDIFYKK